MPGMNSGLNVTNPLLVASFRAALLHQGIIVAVILVLLGMAWVSARELLGLPGSAMSRAGTPEPAGHRLLRISFGVLWIFDGILQAQPGMAVGLPSSVVEPTAASSPGWVQHVVNWAGTSWSYHPIQAGAAAVWIQVGIGAWLLAAPRGRSCQLAGLVSACWGLVVWIFGESFGGIFAPGLTWLFGAPGAALFYCAAGALLALPERFWRTPEPGRRILAAMGLFFIGMAVLQAWPGRGFWQGSRHGSPGTLTSMVQSMAGTNQPRIFAGWVTDFASLTAAHGFIVNLVTVIALAAVGACLLSGEPRLLRPAIGVMAVLCLSDWVLIEDFGFFGGLGTDPNSMIPMALIVIAGYLALTRLPAPAAAAEPVAGGMPPATVPGVATPGTATPGAAAAEPVPGAATAGAAASSAATSGPSASSDPVPAGEPAPRGRGWRDQIRPLRLARGFGGWSTQAILAAWAVLIIVIGAAPMAVAQANRSADPIIAQAIDGSSAALDFTAPAFQLTDQSGRQVSLASLRGKVVLLTFLDPVCTSDCPLIAQEFRAADQMLGAQARSAVLVAIVANPIYRTVAYTRAFDSQERLNTLPNWLFLTGSPGQLQQAWRNYGIAAQILPAGGMIGHSDVAYVIDASGRTRTELDFDPGPGTASSESSFAAELSDAAKQYLKPS
jgi:cytochrome oxidase Cu insertion factor (SCO1/SenC/PrrC family)